MFAAAILSLQRKIQPQGDYDVYTSLTGGGLTNETPTRFQFFVNGDYNALTCFTKFIVSKAIIIEKGPN